MVFILLKITLHLDSHQPEPPREIERRFELCGALFFEAKEKSAEIWTNFNRLFISCSFIFSLTVSKCLNLDSEAKNCAELFKSGKSTSGVYAIDPDGSGAFDVYCDQTTAGGGWTVFQKRLDGSVSFYRGWTDYKNGFGDLNGEFWLGLDKIHRLTKTKKRLRVDLIDTRGNTAYAEYDMFAVTSERTKYKLSLGTYSGK